MIDYTHKDLFEQDSVDKQLLISFDGGEITNNELYAESFELAESLCSESELRFGSCEASVLKFKIANVVDSLKNKWLTVTETLNGNADEPFQFGKYKVYSDVPSGDRNYRNITAYDAMYDIINAEMVEWYNSLEFPMSQKAFRDSFFEYLGITQEETELIHDSMEIEQTFSAESIGGKSIITAICELNGVFGHINRQGNFEYVSLTDNVCEIGANLHQSSEYEDFETSLITKVQVRQEEGDIGGVYGDGSNCYVVQDNFLAFGKDSEELADICERLYLKICNITYRPFKAVIKGNPCYEVGDLVLIHARKKDIQGYVLQRTLKGVQSLKDTFQTNGVQEYSENPNSTSVEIRKLKSKTNILRRTVEETVMKVNEVETATSDIYQTIAEQNTNITQNCENIILEALKSYTETGDFESFKEITEAQLRLLSDQMTLQFAETTQHIADVNGDLQEQLNTITKYFTFDIDGLTIGRAGSPFKVVIDNDRYSMLVNGVEVLWLDPDGTSNIPELKVTKMLDCFGYITEVDSNGNVNTRYGGE